MTLTHQLPYNMHYRANAFESTGMATVLFFSHFVKQKPEQMSLMLSK